MKPISVLMSVYKNDRPEYVRRAVESVTVLQTVQPNEVVMVVDGPVSDELGSEIRKLAEDIPSICPIWLPKNKGLGNALRVGLEAATYELVMRMDSDDISLPDRFEKQLAYIEQHPDVAVLGGQITEFIDDEDNVVGRRIVPQSPKAIANVIKRRCPLNHVSVMLLRSRVLACGNYQEWFWNEDYWLWIRMYEAGYKFANLEDTLVNVRVGKDMYARRGSVRYFKSEEGLQRYMLKKGMINIFEYCFNVAVRFTVQVAMPNWLRAFVFQAFFRS